MAALWSAAAALFFSSPFGSPTSIARVDERVAALAPRHAPQENLLLPSGRPGCAIFCGGEILAAVQLVTPHLFVDSKEFVDMPLRADPSTVRAAFSSRAPRTRAELAEFVHDHFSHAGSDLHPCAPPDWERSAPASIAALSNTTVRAWIKRSVHDAWPSLTRCTDADVAAHPDRHSLLALPFPTVVPGGRFRESYAWDSLWILQGLVESGMLETARGLVLNAAGLISAHGFLPNGGRSYYTSRSQPPVFSLMTLELHDKLPADDGAALLAASYPAAVRELDFWSSRDGGAPHAVTLVDAVGDVHVLSRYVVAHDTTHSVPRPESYREDIETAVRAGFPDVASFGARALFSEIAAAAESGWDFSSRWMGADRSLSTAQTSRVIPVDLNAMLVVAERSLARIARLVGRADDAAQYEAAAAARARAIDMLLWDAPSAQWRDLVATVPAGAGSGVGGAWATRDVSHAVGAVASNYVPLWAGAAGTDAARVRAIADSLSASGLVAAGGVLTSSVHSGEQWDFPNAWAPVQSFIIEGLERAAADAGGEPTAAALAKELARRWLRTGLDAYKEGGMGNYEKYDAVNGGSGGGGEYMPQTGFGWTNGVAVRLAARYDFETLESSVF